MPRSPSSTRFGWPVAGVLPLRWPLPAVCAWGAGWLVWLVLRSAGIDAAAGFGAAVAVSLLLAAHNTGLTRRLIAGAGFPLSALASGSALLPAGAWLVLLLPLLAAYPLRAWRDAPFFPTPAGALHGLDAVVTPPPARIFDAGCGVGHGLAALHALWPRARIVGIESGAALAWLAARRCRFARVVRGDMWAADWSGHDLVYAFQRSDNMARVFDKAQRELAPHAWLVSLEFAVPGREPKATLRCADGRTVWVYQPAADRLSRPIAGSTASAPGR